MKNKKGFTLIELMIVVAIIGILAALAIPDFMKMLAKSKQSEAKTNLGAIFTGEVAYHGENNSFGWTFNQIAWAPEGQNKYNYNINQGSTACALPGEAEINPCDYYASTVTADAGAPTCLNMIDSSVVAFKACADGNIDNDSLKDAWSINERKVLLNDTNDVNLP